MARARRPSPDALPTSAVPPDVVDVLRRSRIEEDRLYLPEKLSRKLYTESNAVLATLGGVWNRGKGAHVFKGSPAAALAKVLDAGAITHAKDLAFFRTPKGLATEVVRDAKVKKGQRVLEPSAGDGAIVDALLAVGAKVTAVEIDPARREGLLAKKRGVKAVTADFLSLVPKDLGAKFDAVVMNPPFSMAGQKRADIDHVLHAVRFVKAGGVVVAIIGSGTAFRSDKASAAFRDLVAHQKGTITAVPKGTFKESGTEVATLKVVLPVTRGMVLPELPAADHAVPAIDTAPKARGRGRAAPSPEPEPAPAPAPARTPPPPARRGRLTEAPRPPLPRTAENNARAQFVGWSEAAQAAPGAVLTMLRHAEDVDLGGREPSPEARVKAWARAADAAEEAWGATHEGPDWERRILTEQDIYDRSERFIARGANPHRFGPGEADELAGVLQGLGSVAAGFNPLAELRRPPLMPLHHAHFRYEWSQSVEGAEGTKVHVEVAPAPERGAAVVTLTLRGPSGAPHARLVGRIEDLGDGRPPPGLSTELVELAAVEEWDTAVLVRAWCTLAAGYGAPAWSARLGAGNTEAVLRAAAAAGACALRQTPGGAWEGRCAPVRPRVIANPGPPAPPARSAFARFLRGR